MAAIISTGTATSNVDLLQKLVTWLVTRGYTSNMSQAWNEGWRAHLNKGGVYVNLCAAMAGLGEATWSDQYSLTNFYSLNLYIGTGYNGSNVWNNQSGGPTQNGTSSTVGVAAVTGSGAITSYQFIDDGNDNILIVIERSPGIFRHLYWGTLTKYGSWTGGIYFGGSSSGCYGATPMDPGLDVALCPFAVGDISTSSHACFVRANIDAFTAKWICGGLSTNYQGNLGWTGKSLQSGISNLTNIPSTDVPCINYIIKNYLHSSLSGRIITLPIIIYAARDAGGYSAIGEAPGLRLCQASAKGLTIGTDVVLGPETWRVFGGFAIKVA